MKYVAIIFLFLISSQISAQEVVSVTEVMVWVKATDRSGKTINRSCLSRTLKSLKTVRR